MHSHPNDLFPVRIKRTSFFLRGELLIGAGFLNSLLFGAAHHASALVQVVCIGSGLCGLVFLFTAMFRSLLMPRLRDVGLHPAWSLLILVHALNGLFLLALLVVPSDAFPRRRYIL